MATTPPHRADPLRYRHGVEHLAAPFGADSFGQHAEAFARFFGTPTFIIAQTAIVVTWIVINAVGIVHFDVYPFILLNLAFSTQAAYAAPLILLAQTRQADRDKAGAEADARHREDIAKMAESQERQVMALLEQNTRLTERIDHLMREIHGRLLPDAGP